VNQPYIELETPALLVDLDRLSRNLDRAADYARDAGLRLRPHVKTHKSSRIAADQLRRGASGLTCATPYEAEVMAAGVGGPGVTERRRDPKGGVDILLAYPPVGVGRAERLLALPDNIHPVAALDSIEAVRQLSAAARRARRRAAVYVEMDLGMHRVGVQSVADALELARAVADDEWLDFEGLGFYPGHIRSPIEEQDEQLAGLSRALTGVIDEFERAGLRPKVVSGGSTPTLWRSHEITGVTEIRPGTYVFNDRATAQIGACKWDDCALTVLATVVSTAVPDQAVIDAGTKALGREPVRGAPGEGFGALLDRPDVVVKAMSEEHGLLDLSSTDWRPAVGDLVRVVPNHVCVAVHLADGVHGIRGESVAERWAVEARGR
jgi:D-serine deaminase-like pyridoxal phosphate-dependent protein